MRLSRITDPLGNAILRLGGNGNGDGDEPEEAVVEATESDGPKKKRLPRGLAGEKGVTGLESVAGRIKREYNTNLATLSSRMTTFEEMRRSDTAIAVMEALISLPIRETTWDLEPGDDPALAEHVAENLGVGGGAGQLTHSFDEMLRQILLAPLYGFTVQEKVFEYKDDGLLGWRKFPERDRTTVNKWQFDTKGGLAGIEQRGYKPGTYEIVTKPIDIEKLVIWTWRPEAGDPEGFGMMRQAYKAWMMKAAFEEFAAIRIERQACGIPWAYGPEEGYSDADSDTVLEMLHRLRTGEQTGGVSPFGWEIRMLEMGPADVPFESHLEREHQYILQSGLMGFIGLGQGGDTGAWALSRDLSSIFLMVLNATADWVAEGFNRYVIPQIVGLNRTGVKKPPQLVHGSIAIRDPRVLAEAVKNLFDPTLDLRVRAPEVEAHLRELFDLPPATVSPGTGAKSEETDSEKTPELQEVEK